MKAAIPAAYSAGWKTRQKNSEFYAGTRSATSPPPEQKSRQQKLTAES
jgi:hypothetical protein